MIQRLVAIFFLGFCFIKTILCRIFKIRRRGLPEFRRDYYL